jgi:hypothetical protein
VGYCIGPYEKEAGFHVSNDQTGTRQGMKLPEFGTVHISVCAEDMTGRHFAERLGFRPNGVVKANGGGQTYLGYVR